MAVRLRRLANAAELAAQEALEKALSGSTWRVALKPRVQDVIEKGDHEELPEEAFSLYTRGHFDFVVYSGTDGRPELAIELDGPMHQHPDQVERDILKNRLCAEADFPLLRFGSGSLALAEQVALLASLGERFVRWKQELKRLSDAPRGGLRRGRSDNADEIELFASSLSESRLPVNVESARQLHRAGICAGREFGGHQPEPDAPYLLRPSWPGKRWREYVGCSEYVAVELPVFVRSRDNPSRLVQITGSGRFSAALQVGPGEYWVIPLAWLDSEWMAAELALHDALKKTAAWAAASGKSSPRTVLATPSAPPASKLRLPRRRRFE